MIAARRFLEALSTKSLKKGRLQVTLHGSLAFTGVGHGTDKAVALGLLGEHPDAVNPDMVDALLAELDGVGSLNRAGFSEIAFFRAKDIIFSREGRLPRHSNGMTFSLHDAAGRTLLEERYYSIGGGFVLSDAEFEAEVQANRPACAVEVPYPFATADEMLAMGRRSGLPIAEMKRANETASLPERDVNTGLDELWRAMLECMERGLRSEGILPGGLNVRRRAAAIRRHLIEQEEAGRCSPHRIMDWVSLYAMAVNEENAVGGRVVTAPTNGAAGVIPAVLRYYRDHCAGADMDGIRTFLLTAGAIGGLIKHNASVSGAEVGCQGEIGSASAMAAAGLAAALGGSNEQIENAAEIALEHHLGMTCDPIAGLVQVPCIERNAFGANKAINAASLALHGDGAHFVSLDACIRTMLQTGRDMNERYKETSTGGLAVNVVEC